MRKGQAALEFLMTYGWAILVVLAAIAALAYFGVLSPDKFLPSKCVISGGFSCTQYKITAVAGAAGTVDFRVQNNLGVGATDVVVTFKSADCLTDVAGIDSPVVSIENGEVYDMPQVSCDVGTGGELTTADKVRGTISIVYTRSGETVSHTASGTLAGNAEIE